jgi:hypothetical protein
MVRRRGGEGEEERRGQRGSCREGEEESRGRVGEEEMLMTRGRGDERRGRARRWGNIEKEIKRW